MEKVKEIAKQVEAKLGDHPNVSADAKVNPSSGVQNLNSRNDPGKSNVQNRIEDGQGADHDKETISAGNTTSADTQPATKASGAL